MTDLDAGGFFGARVSAVIIKTSCWKIAPGDVLLSYPDGSAALTVSAAGSGAMVLANLPLTPDGGDFIGNPIFPAMLHELLRALRHDSAERAVTPGAAWLLDVPTTGEGAVTVTDPEGKTVDAQVVASGRNDAPGVAGGENSRRLFRQTGGRRRCLRRGERGPARK